ncbi:hypothetical protein E2C01_055904 [Portunus trituberculatus]|uniref:Uncharacterized protein n=1 Tax=Portunus trituberculatus TaxID=210409 RepID=A0A5B7GVZ6_PORTR|nr:hypothetical protein [Portunus trituberculatus]
MALLCFHHAQKIMMRDDARLDDFSMTSLPNKHYRRTKEDGKSRHQRVSHPRQAAPTPASWCRRSAQLDLHLASLQSHGDDCDQPASPVVIKQRFLQNLPRSLPVTRFHEGITSVPSLSCT